jgi:preprotein translocase subunit SecA
MPAKKKVNYKKLLEAVKAGKNQSEIMKEFKFNTSAQFKNHYLDALIEKGEAPAIVKSRASKQEGPAKEASVSKRGSVVISKGLIAEMGFAEGDTFAVRKTKSGISLRKMD